MSADAVTAAADEQAAVGSGQPQDERITALPVVLDAHRQWATRPGRLRDDASAADVAQAELAMRRLGASNTFAVLESPLHLGAHPRPREEVDAAARRRAAVRAPQPAPDDPWSTMGGPDAAQAAEEYFEAWMEMLASGVAFPGRNPHEVAPPPPAPVPVPALEHWPEVSATRFADFVARLRRARGRALVTAAATARSRAAAAAGVDVPLPEFSGDEPEARAALRAIDADPTAPTPARNRARRRAWRAAVRRGGAIAGRPTLPLGCGADDPLPPTSLTDWDFGFAYDPSAVPPAALTEPRHSRDGDLASEAAAAAAAAAAAVVGADVGVGRPASACVGAAVAAAEATADKTEVRRDDEGRWRLAGVTRAELPDGVPREVALPHFEELLLCRDGLFESMLTGLPEASPPPSSPPPADSAAVDAAANAATAAASDAAPGARSMGAAQHPCAAAVANPMSPRAWEALAASLEARQQQVLAWTDSVEGALAAALPPRRAAFFQALDMVQSLRAKTRAAADVAGAARLRARRIRDENAVAGLRVTSLLRRAQRLDSVRSLALRLREAARARDTLRAALRDRDTGAIWSAMSAVQRAKTLLDGPLRRSDAASRLRRSVRHEDASVKDRVRKAPRANGVPNGVPNGGSAGRVERIPRAAAALASLRRTDASLRFGVRPLLAAALALGRHTLTDLLEDYRRRLDHEVGEALRTEVAESFRSLRAEGQAADDGADFAELFQVGGSRKSVAADHLQALSSRAFARVLRDASTSLEALLRRALALHHCMEEAIDDAEASAAADAVAGGLAASPAEAAAMSPSGRERLSPVRRGHIDPSAAARARAISASVVAAAASVAQRKLARLLEVRAPSHCDPARRLDDVAAAWDALASFEQVARAAVATATGAPVARLEQAAGFGGTSTPAEGAAALAAGPGAGAGALLDGDGALGSGPAGPISQAIARQAVARIGKAGEVWNRQVKQALLADRWIPAPVGGALQALVGVSFDGTTTAGVASTGAAAASTAAAATAATTTAAGARGVAEAGAAGADARPDPLASADWLVVPPVFAVSASLGDAATAKTGTAAPRPGAAAGRADADADADADAAGGGDADAPAAVPPAWCFRVCASVQVLVKVCNAAIAVSDRCHAAAPDAARAISRLLATFGVNTVELILEARAVSHGTLRTVTTRHLGVALRSLQACVALARLWERRLAACLPATAGFVALSGMRQTIQELESHAESVLAKVADIVKALVDRAASGLASQDWEAVAPPPPAGPSEPTPASAKPGDDDDGETATDAEGGGGSGSEAGPGALLALPSSAELAAPLAPLAKGLRTLGRILSSLLPAEPLEDVCGRIAVMMSAELPLHASSVDADSMTVAGRRGAAAHLGAVVVALSLLPGCSAPPGSAGAEAGTAGQVAVLSLVRWVERQFGAEGAEAAAAIRASLGSP
ncbi:hypothetical protein FNF29_06435 [Cafeteria roenbergensis]|uniref:Vacuolar protein sorting-associated protein 54 C-terminal domain-containing protein n=1 Tax=Cafeteria roenbergensis TaxID=33653 RepID=A0A5A8C9S4_CAFRO|nr:hypothetical protein FNF29_06435 [Cafeteria roenbergensis]|eukprot:KAA0148810.1 hypothetical protein FNF29_06435 [Cafeteria roenbergensis]